MHNLFHLQLGVL